MNGYTVKNIKQLANAAERLGGSVDYEARFARQDLGCEQVGLSYQRLGPNAEGPFGHSHDKDEEVYVVISGSGRFMLGEEIAEVGPWDAIRVAPDMFRAFASGPEGLEILAFGTHTDNDASMKDADWSAREG
jgi:uncharacterized cupin superfamily protein